MTWAYCGATAESVVCWVLVDVDRRSSKHDVNGHYSIGDWGFFSFIYPCMKKCNYWGVAHGLVGR